MGCAGDPVAKTPHLDRLAAEGVRFTRCISASPVCSPWRGSMQTGMHAHSHTVWANNRPLPGHLTGFAEVFRDAGYATGYIGKWHLEGRFGHLAGTQTRRGIPGGVVPEGKRRFGWDEWQGYDVSHEFLNVWKFNELGEKTPVDGYDWEPTWHTDQAVDFITRQTKVNRPWCYYVAYGPPHDPEQCPPDFVKLYDGAEFPRPDGSLDALDTATRRELDRRSAIYYGQVTAIDHEVGRLMAALKHLEVADDTIVIYVSDHGDTLGSHLGTVGSLRTKATPHRASFMTPFLVRWPKNNPQGLVLDTLVSSVDLAPTILDLAGLHIPRQMQGLSMAKWCQGRHGPDQQVLYLGVGEPNTVDAWRAVWDGKYLYSTGRFNELYNCVADPEERENLRNIPGSQSVLRHYHQILVEQAAHYHDPHYRYLLNSA